MRGTGLVNGMPLEARGELLDPDSTAEQQGQRTSVHLPTVRDWVIDHSHPPTLWLVTDAAWYRCACLSTLPCDPRRHAARTHIAGVATLSMV